MCVCVCVCVCVCTVGRPWRHGLSWRWFSCNKFAGNTAGKQIYIYRADIILAVKVSRRALAAGIYCPSSLREVLTEGSTTYIFSFSQSTLHVYRRPNTEDLAGVCSCGFNNKSLAIFLSIPRLHSVFVIQLDVWFVCCLRPCIILIPLVVEIWTTLNQWSFSKNIPTDVFLTSFLSCCNKWTWC